MVALTRVQPYDAFLLLFLFAAWQPPYFLLCYCRGWPPTWRSLIWLAVMWLLTTGAWVNALRNRHLFYNLMLSVGQDAPSRALSWWDLSEYWHVFHLAAVILLISSTLTALYWLIRRPDLRRSVSQVRVKP